MRFGAFLPLFFCWFFVHPAAASETPADSKVVLILRYDRHPSAVATRALTRELTSVMHQAHVDLDLLTSVPAGLEASRLVTVNMHGYCGMDGSSEQARNRSPLGSTSVAEGQMLPFVTIDCNKIRASLASVVGTGSPQEHQILYGRAVAKVMAHELYHVLAEASQHTETGVTQGELSPSELASPSVGLPDQARDAIEERARAR